MSTDPSEHALAEELRSAVSRFVRTVRQQADTLPSSRTEVLRHLRDEGAQTMAVLAAARGVSHQGVSRMVGELERQGLLLRTPDPADARAFRIDLTPAGRRALAEDEQARRTLIEEAIRTRLDEHERATLRQVPALLDRLTGAVDTRTDRRD